MDKRQVDSQLLKRMYFISRFYLDFGRAFNEALFPDDVAEAKKVKLKDR